MNEPEISESGRSKPVDSVLFVSYRSQAVFGFRHTVVSIFKIKCGTDSRNVMSDYFQTLTENC